MSQHRQIKNRGLHKRGFVTCSNFTYSTQWKFEPNLLISLVSPVPRPWKLVTIQTYRVSLHMELLQSGAFDRVGLHCAELQKVVFKKGSLRGSWIVRKSRQRKSHPVAPMAAHLAPSHLQRQYPCKTWARVYSYFMVRSDVLSSS